MARLKRQVEKPPPRGRILQAARELFYREGINPVSVDSIAAPRTARARRPPPPAWMAWSASCSDRRPREKGSRRSTSHDLLPLVVQGRTKSPARAIFLGLAQGARGLDDSRDQAVVDGFFRV